MRSRPVISVNKVWWPFAPNFRNCRQWVLTALWLTLLASLLWVPTSATAGVSLSVEAGQPGFPINVFVSVTDEDGAVTGLEKDDFEVWVGGGLPKNPNEFFSRAEDPDQRLSVVFVMDFTQTIALVDALEAVQNATRDYIDSLAPGDYAAIVKFNVFRDGDSVNRKPPEVRKAFTEIIGGESAMSAWDAVIYDESFLGTGTNAFDGLRLALRKFDTTDALLPDGPKAVIHVSDGEDNQSEVDRDFVVALAQGLGIRIFTIAVGDFEEEWQENMEVLADRTGGQEFDARTNFEETVRDAYGALAALLESEYILTLDTGVNNCDEQELTVEVNGEEATTTFSHTGCLPDGGSGGGGSLGLLELLAGLSLLALRRRLGFA